MLEAFIGTYDKSGLRSLRPDGGVDPLRLAAEPNSVLFWAVLDWDELPVIRQAVIDGRRQSALRLLNERALTLGGITR